MKRNHYLIAVLLLAMPFLVHAGPIELLNSSLRSAISAATDSLQRTAILWLSSLVLIQFLITNIGLLKSGADMEAVIGKFMGSMLWFGFCFYVMQNGTDFITNVSRGMFDTAKSMAGSSGFDAGFILDDIVNIAANLLAAISEASGWENLFMPSLIGGILAVVLLSTGVLLAFKVFLIKIELMIIIMMAPLSFAFLGLNALKDQGIAPFKALISLLYRVLLLALIMKTMGGLTDELVAVIKTINKDSIDGIWSTLFSATMGYVLLGLLSFKSDSIASSLASGSTNLGTADVASAAAMGAAAGAVATGGLAAVAGGLQSAANMPKAMGDVIGNMLAQGGSSISNASSSGAGATPGAAPSRGAAMSTNGAAASSGPPKRIEGSASAGAGPSKGIGSGSATGSSTNAGSSAPMRSSGSSGGAAPAPAAAPAASADASGFAGANSSGASTTNAVGGGGSATDAIPAGASPQDATAGGLGSSGASPADAIPGGSGFSGTSPADSIPSGASPSRAGHSGATSATPSTSPPSQASANSVGASSVSASPGGARPPATGSTGTVPTGAGTAGESSSVGASDGVGSSLGGTDSVSSAPNLSKGTEGGTSTSNSSGAPQRPQGSNSKAADSAAGAPKRPSAEASPGSGRDAAIAGANPLEQKVSDLVEAMKSGQNQNQKPSIKDHVKEFGRHVEQERAHTSVSINTHNSD